MWQGASLISVKLRPKDGAYKVNGSHRLPAPKAEGG